MIRNHKEAREMWTPPVRTITWEQFVKEAHRDANEAQIDELLKTATRDDLLELVSVLRKRLAGAEFAARLNGDTVRALWRAKR